MLFYVDHVASKICIQYICLLGLDTTKIRWNVSETLTRLLYCYYTTALCAGTWLKNQLIGVRGCIFFEKKNYSEGSTNCIFGWLHCRSIVHPSNGWQRARSFATRAERVGPRFVFGHSVRCAVWGWYIWMACKFGATRRVRPKHATCLVIDMHRHRWHSSFIIASLLPSSPPLRRLQTI